jgi:hypothetical protein
MQKYPRDFEREEERMAELLGKASRPAPCPPPDQLLALEEGVLPEDVAREIEVHIASCRLCEMLRSDLAEPSIAEPTLDQIARVRRRVKAGASSRGRLIVRYGAIAATLATVAILGSYLFRDYRRPASERIETVKLPPEFQKTPPIEYHLPLEKAPLKLPLPAMVVLRGVENQENEAYLKELGAAMEPYRSDRFEEASRRLESLAGRYPAAVEPVFYLGVSRLLQNDLAGAATALEKARKIGGEALNDDIAWYLAVAYERSRGFEHAAPALKALCAGEGAYREAACAALRGRP